MQTKEKTNVVMQRYFRYLLASFLCFLLFMSTSTRAENADSGYRYLRLTALSGVSTYDIYIYEIEWMLGSTSYPITRKTSGTASTVTATVETGNAWIAFDGVKNSGLWTPNVTTYPFSITCDLGAGISINPSGVKISIEWNARALSSFTCEGSNDKVAWTNLYIKSGLTENDWVRDATNNFVFPVPDVQAPTVPANLNVAKINQSGCTLSWTASTDNVAVAAYEVFKDGVSLGTTATTTLNITGLSSSSTYVFTVKAKDASENISAASSPANVTTTAPDLAAPSKPAALISLNITFSAFTLSWTASTDNVGVALYEVFRGSSSCGTTTSTSLKIVGLTASTGYSMTVIAKDAAGNISPASEPKIVTTSVYIPGATGFLEDFNDNKLTGWYAGSYGLSEQNKELKIVPVKNSVWDGFGFSFPEITIKDAPYISLKIKSNFDFNISMAVGKLNGKIDNYPLRITTVGLAGVQEIVAGSEFQEYSFDFTGLPAGMLDSISNLHFVLNPLTRDFGPAPDKEIYFDDIRIGDLALHTPAISSIPDQIFTLNMTETQSRKVYFRNVTDGSTDKNPISIGISSSNTACIPDPLVNYTSPKRTGYLELKPNVSAAGESVISVSVSAPNTINKVMTFKVKVVPNAAPTMTALPDMLVKKGNQITVPLDQINDGNPETTQKVTITAESSDLNIIPELSVKHDSTDFSGLLSFKTGNSASTGADGIITVKLKDNGGTASGGKDETSYSFKVSVFDEINHVPTLDAIAPKSVKAIAGKNNIPLSGISDGDNNTQALDFVLIASTDTVVKNLSIGTIDHGNTVLNFDLTGKTGATTITIKVSDKGGNPLNNGDLSVLRSFVITAVPVPVTGLIADYTPFISTVAASGISNDQNGGKVEIMADGTVHLSGTVMQQTFPSVYFNLDKLTNGKELDISQNKYVSFKFKGAITNQIEAPEKKPLDKTKIFFRLVDNINPGAPGSGYNVSFIELNLANDDQWHDVYLDFSGLFLKTKDGNQTDSTRISRLMLDINDLWFQQIKGDYYFKDIKLGDLADRPQVVAHPSLNPISVQVIVKGEKVRPILLTGINDGLGKPTATLTVFADKPALISGISIGNIINGTALLNYSMNTTTNDSVRISVIARNTSYPNSVPDTVSFRIYSIDKTTMAGNTVTIDFSKTYQTFSGMGTMLNNGSNHDQVQQVKDMNITMMRLTSDGEFEPVNDNPDPNVTDYSNFNRKALPTAVIREINEQTNCHKFFYTPWSPPNWMKMNKGSNPDPATLWAGNNKLKPEMYEEYAEYLVAICKTIKEESGVELYAISMQNEPTFNEPYSSCQYTGAEFRDLVKVVGPRLKAENLSTRIMLSEDVNANNWLQSNVGPANTDADARKYLGIIACHLYDPDGVRVGGTGSSAWTSALNLKKSTLAEGLWMTETSGFGNVWEGYWGKDYLSGNPQFFPGPLDFAGSIYTSFKAGQISAWTDFEGTAFKTQNDLAGAVFKNFSAYLNPDAVMVDATSDNSKVLALAFKNADNTTSTILLNSGKSPLKVILKGNNVPKNYRVFTTQDSSPFVEGINVSDGSVVLPPRSITTLYHSTANLAPTVDQQTNRFIELAAGDQNISLEGLTYGADTNQQSVISVVAVTAKFDVVNTFVDYTPGSNSANLRISPINYGTTLVSVKVRDNGGIAGGGIDTLNMKFFVTVVSKLNHEPTINELAPINVPEDADSISVDLTGISDGDQGTQQLSFAITSSDPELVLPRISYQSGSAKASLIFKPAANKNGQVNFDVIVSDNGGNETNNGNMSARMTIPANIIPVNDAPVIKAILTSATVKAGILKRFPIIVEDGDQEITQTLSYELRNQTPEIADASFIDNQNNSLTVNVKGKKSGTAILTFALKDNGGITDGGVDTSKVTFTVTIESSVGFEELNQSGISIYPNPADDFVILKLNNEKAENIVITDLNGNIVLKQEVSAGTREYKLPIANLSAGVYLVTVSQQGKTNTIRFIHRK